MSSLDGYLLELPVARLQVPPAVEARLTERQRKILAHTLETGSVTTGWCMEALGVARDAAHRDLVDLVTLKLLVRKALKCSGRSGHSYMDPSSTSPSSLGALDA